MNNVQAPSKAQLSSCRGSIHATNS